MSERISEKYGKEPGILTEYMDFLVEKRELSPSTAYNYYMSLRSLAKYLKHERAHLDCAPDEVVLHRVSIDDMVSISETEWKRYLSYYCYTLKEKPGSFALRISVVHGFYNWLAVKTSSDPIAFIMDTQRPAKEIKEQKTVTPALEKQICDSLNSREFAARNICIVKMFLRCGIGLQEICDLKLEDVELNNIRVTDAKGDIRHVPLDPETKEALDEYLGCRIPPVDGKNTLFVSKAKKKMKSDSIGKMLRKATRSGTNSIHGITVRDIQRTAKTNMFTAEKSEGELFAISKVKSKYYFRNILKNTSISENI